MTTIGETVTGGIARVRTRVFVSHGTTLSAFLACLVAFVSFAKPIIAHGQQATFTPLGKFGGNSSNASDISADGTVIVGTTTSPGPTVSVFRLTPQGSTVRPGSGARVSADGSTVVGRYQSQSGEEAFRWVGDAPFEGLGDLPGGDFQSSAFGVSADGSVVVGASAAQSRLTAFRWTASGGMTSLGGDERTAVAVSADGSTVAGGLWLTDQNAGPAYRWTAQAGSMELPTLPRPRFTSAEARAVTADGSIVVGYNQFREGNSGLDQEAFRWTQQEGTTSLQSAGWSRTIALDVSGDGSVVVGDGALPGTLSSAAFIWTAKTGMISLREALIFGGATNLDGWSLGVASGISADGRMVVGQGTGPNGLEAFVATIGAIPEPSTSVLAVIAAAALPIISICKAWSSKPTTPAAAASTRPVSRFIRAGIAPLRSATQPPTLVPAKRCTRSR